MPQLDDLWDNVVVKTLSPSSFSWIRNGCAYQVLLQKAINSIDNDACTLPFHKNTILGTVIHRIFELTSKGELSTPNEMLDKWEQLVDEQMKKMTEKYPTLRNSKINDYDKRNKAIRYAISLKNSANVHPNTSSSDVQIYSEKKLYCADIGLLGIVDKLIVDSGNVDILDYKSGYVADAEGNLKPEYIIQLHLYAEMCIHLSLGNIRAMKLIDIAGNCHNVSFNESFSKKLVSEVSGIIKTLNEALSTRQFHDLVRPDNERCENCSCRHVCSYMIQSEDALYKTISGVVERINSSNIYVLKSKGEEYYISGIDLYQVDRPEDYIGKKLVFLNVIRASQVSDKYTYRVTENTLVYELQ